MYTYHHKIEPCSFNRMPAGYLEGDFGKIANQAMMPVSRLNFCQASQAKYIMGKDTAKSGDLKENYIAAYVDTVYDSAEVVGTQIADLVTVSSNQSRYTAV